MSLQVDPLEKYYMEEEDPLAQYYEEPPYEKYKAPFDKLTQKAKQDFGDNRVEPDITDEFERMYEYGDSQAAKGLLSGATLGLSELVPSLKPDSNPASITGEVVGSFAPIGKLINFFSKPLVNLAQKSPVLGRQLESLANLTGVGLAGGTYGTINKAAKDQKMPSVDDFVEHGAEWALLDAALQTAGAGGRFASSLIKKAKNTNKPSWKVVNDVISQLKKDGVDFNDSDLVNAKALSILEEPPVKKGTGDQVRKVTKPQEDFFRKEQEKIEALKNTKVSPNTLEKLSGNVDELSQPYVPGNFKAQEILEEGFDKDLITRIESVGQRAETQKAFGQNVKGDIERKFQAAKAEYEPAYQLAEEASSFIYTQPRETAQVGLRVLESIAELKTKPAGYSTVIKNLETALEDAGWNIERDGDRIVQVVLEKDVPVSKLIKLKQRLSKIVSFDLLDTGVENSLKPVIKAIKKDIESALMNGGEAGMDAYEMLKFADKTFGDAAQLFGKKSIQKIRTSETPELIAKTIRSPSQLADIKAIVTPEQFSQIERELLEHMNSLSQQRARDFYREIRPSLTEDTQILANDIINSKDPVIKSKSIRDDLTDSLINELAKSSVSGERPTRTLNLWKTERGQQLIENALKDNPNKKEMLDYLQKQSFNDFTKSFIDADGSIDFKKLKELIKDPATLQNIKRLGGEEAVTAFKNLETLSKNIEKNIANLDQLSQEKQALSKKILGKETQKLAEEAKPSKIARGEERLKTLAQKTAPLDVMVNNFIKNLDPTTKTFLTVLGVYKIVPVTAGYASYKLLSPILKSKSFRQALQKAAVSRNDPRGLINALETINKEFEEE